MKGRLWGRILGAKGCVPTRDGDSNAEREKTMKRQKRAECLSQYILNPEWHRWVYGGQRRPYQHFSEPVSVEVDRRMFAEWCAARRRLRKSPARRGEARQGEACIFSNSGVE